MDERVEIDAENFPKTLIPIGHRFPIPRNNLLPRMRVSCKISFNCIYHTIKDYITYATKTSGKKLMTLFDVGTDIRTFTILWADSKAAYWSCFLLSSIMLPYIVFWGSSFNFENATRTHTEFNKRKAKTCGEKCTRIFYYLITFPIIGLVVTFIQISMWWFVEIILGLFHQRKHKECVKNVERRENARLNNTISEEERVLFRSLPMFPSVNAARYLTIIELFFESIPQCMLQIYIYLKGTSEYFTFQDIVISVTASIMNIIMNIVSITRDAHSVGMSLADYIVYFMGDRIGNMLVTMIPIRKTLGSSKQNVCNLTGFPSIYRTEITSSLASLLVYIDTPPTLKTIILPTPHTEIPCEYLSRLIYLIALARYKENVHITFLQNIIPDFKYLVLSEDFIKYSKNSHKKQADEVCLCVDDCQDLLNIIQCCNVKCGNLVCGEKEITIDQSIYQGTKKKMCCDCFSVCVANKHEDVTRKDSLTTEKHNKLIRIVRYLWLILKYKKSSEQIKSNIANIIIVYILVGDYDILLSIHTVLKSKYRIPLLDMMVKGIMDMAESIKDQEGFHTLDEEKKKERVLTYELLLRDIFNNENTITINGEGKIMV